jgi:hypothetical protein
MAIRPPKFDPAALISEISETSGLPVAEIAPEIGMSRGHTYKLATKAARRASTPRKS